MSSSKGVPDAWDDDWVDSQASTSKPADETPTPPKKLSKAERRRQQLEFNKKLWEEAEAPENPYFVQKSNDVPLQSGFTPQMKLLSRRPAPRIARKDPVTGLEQLSLEDDKDDEEEDERKPGQMTMEERIEKAKKEREEKQRKYDEVRQRLFGSAGGESGASSPASNGRGNGGASSPQRSERGGGSGGRGRGRGNAGSTKAIPGRQLFDPNSSSRGGSASSSGTITPMEGMPMRAPRGPDGSGRGGRGFVNRGGQGTATS